MLQSLHVKNLALIEETEIEFDKGLNILTGETGAGKSILIGSINLALGSKFEKDILRKGADFALVELIFQTKDDKVIAKMDELELPQEADGTIIINRRMQIGKSISKINGETVTIKQIKELAELLIDIHGQHEHQSLLHKKNHMQILDSFCGDEIKQPVEDIAQLYTTCKKLKQTIEEESLDEESKDKEMALAEFEFKEIENAKLVIGEDDNLEQLYNKMVHSKKIRENLAESYHFTCSDNADGASNSLSRALKALSGITMYDEQLEQLEEQLTQIDTLLADYNHDVADYMEDSEFDEESFKQIEERLNDINHLKEKYGSTIEEILEYSNSRAQILEKLADYNSYMEGLQAELSHNNKLLEQACASLSEVRKKNAKELTLKLQEALVHLNFLTVVFEVAVKPEQTITMNGYDDVEFMISTNPGEDLKPLSQVASGGELSRVMLAIKTVLAGRDSIDTLIFDEIDAGISGKTAWKVSQQLAVVAGSHQVICITHLPQIAAMADTHFVIEKSSTNDSTITDIRKTGSQESLSELARLLGSDTMTDAALINAKEMKETAGLYKKQL